MMARASLSDIRILVFLLVASCGFSTTSSTTTSTITTATSTSTPISTTNQPNTTNASPTFVGRFIFRLTAMLQGMAGQDYSGSGTGNGQNGSGVTGVTPQCEVDLETLSEGVNQGEMWAWGMLDAMGKLQAGLLTGQAVLMGDYDLCLAQSYQYPNGTHTLKAQYCTVAATPPTTLIMSPVLTRSPIFAAWYAGYKMHTCVPKSCTTADLLLVFNAALNPTVGSKVTSVMCNRDLHPTQDKAFIVAVSVFALLGFLCLVGTAYGVWVDRDRNQQPCTSYIALQNGTYIRTSDPIFQISAPSSSFHGASSYLPSSSSVCQLITGVDNQGFDNEESPNKEKCHVTVELTNGGCTEQHKEDLAVKELPASSELGLASKLLLSFSVLRNGRKILNCGQMSSDLACLHGIRAISILWVVFGHSFGLTTDMNIGNPAVIPKLLNGFESALITAGLFVVDTFYLLGGVLTAYIFVRSTEKAGFGVSTMIIFYVHRIWRMTPLYALVLAFWIGIFPYLKTGPFADQVTLANDAETICRKFWHHNLLYVTNLLDPAHKMCFGISWFAAVIMQFHLVAPLVLVPFVFRGRIRIAGLVMAACMVLTHIVASFVISYTNDGLTLFVDNGDKYYPQLYIAPWCRIGPYAMGLVVGYYLHRTQCKFTMTKLLAVVGWLFAIAVGLSVSLVGYDKYRTMLAQGLQWRGWDIPGTAVYEALSRVVWGAFMCWVIFACSTGNGGFINTFLSWKGWVVLSRLTYGVYFLHFVILHLIATNRRKLFYFDEFSCTVLGCGLAVLSFLAAFVFSLLTEVPAIAMEKAVLQKALKKHSD